MTLIIIQLAIISEQYKKRDYSRKILSRTSKRKSAVAGHWCVQLGDDAVHRHKGNLVHKEKSRSTHHVE